MILIVSILIVYGITLIIVQGSIFNNLRNYFKNKFEYYNKKINLNQEDIFLLIEQESSEIPQKHLKIYNELYESIQKTEQSSPMFQRLVEAWDLANKTITDSLKTKRNSFSNRLGVYVFSKIDKFINCMMCMAFWVGLGLILISLFTHITIFGLPLILLEGITIVDKIVGIFLLSCMFSGTTWSINAIIDTLDEYKNKLG